MAELGTHSPIMNALILIEVNEEIVATTKTDAYGFFTIKLPQKFENQSFTLITESVEMVNHVLNFNNYAAVLNSQLFIAMEKAKNIKLAGVVIDSASGETLVGASVVLTGTTKGTLTDLDGHFDLEVSDKLTSKQNFSLTFSYTGYENKTLAINYLEGTNDLKIALTGGAMAEGIIVVAGGITSYRPNFFQRTKYKFKRFLSLLRNK